MGIDLPSQHKIDMRPAQSLKDMAEGWQERRAVTGPRDESAYVRSCTEISSGTSHGLLTDDCLLLLSGLVIC